MQPKDTAQDQRTAAAGAPQKRITSQELLGGHKELIILHGSDEYRLRVTSNAKLILTK